MKTIQTIFEAPAGISEAQITKTQEAIRLILKDMQRKKPTPMPHD